jgi:ATP-binding cassette subfamily B multidrug efflux pump
MNLHRGYDTQLDQRGQNPSIGQRQQLSLARALVADPDLHILDEATASNALCGLPIGPVII